MTKKTITSAILDANGNNGLHSERALYTAHTILKHNDLRQPIMYHLIFTGGTIAQYQAAIKALVKHLRRNKCRTEYFGAYENQPLKGIHAHLFLVIETATKFPDKIIDIRDGGYLHKLAERHKLVNPDGSTRRIHLAPPQNPMHGGELFARPVVEGGKLENCLEWATYVYKNRSKHNVPSREIYFNSEFNSNRAKREATKFRTNKKPVQPSTNINDKEQTMTITLTEAGHAYVAGHYKRFTEKELNVAEIRRALSDAGIPRTLRQVREDLSRYGYPEYAATHEGSLPPTLREVAEQEEGKKAKPTRRLDFKPCPDYEASKRSSIADSIRRGQLR